MSQLKCQKARFYGSAADVIHMKCEGAQWLSGRVLDSRPRGRRFEPHLGHCVVVHEQDTFILALYWFNPGKPVPI